MLASAPAALQAQRVPGIGSDAIVLPSGTLRVSVDGRMDSWRSRFSSDEAGAPMGSRVPLGAELGGEAVGATQIGALAPLEARLGSLTGLPSFRLSIGDVGVRAEARRSALPIRMELGLGHRLQLSAMVPYVETQVVVATSVNPSAGDGWNVGQNPALSTSSAATQNEALVGQLRAAAGALETALAGCGGAEGSPACADQEAARARGEATLALATEIAELYGLPGESGALVVPRRGSAAAAGLDGRIANLRAYYSSVGIDRISEDAAPANASQPLTATTFGDLLTGLDVPLPRSVTKYGVGDVELGARLLLVDSFAGDAPPGAGSASFGFRASLDGLVRLGTGRPPDADRLLDVGTGDGQTDLEVGGVADLMVGRRFWTSAAFRYGYQMAGDRELRIPSQAGESYAAVGEAESVRVSPGNYVEFEVTPRVSLGDFVSLATQYRFRHRAADVLERMTGAEEAAPAPLDWMGRMAEGTEHRVGVGLTLSTMSAYAAGRIGTPLDVSYLHTRTVAGSGPGTARMATDQVTVRVYLGVFGRRR